MTEVVRVKLTAGGIDNVIAKLKEIDRNLERGIKDMLDNMASQGEVYAINVALHRVNTGETINSIVGYRDGNRAIIEAGGNAVWVEFGAGVFHNPTPYPGELPPPVVGIGQYGKGHGADPGGWYFYSQFEIQGMQYAYYSDKLDMYVYHTHGIERTAFMYNTLQMIKSDFEVFAKAVEL